MTTCKGASPLFVEPCVPLYMPLPSPLIERVVDAFATLPGIGRKTALRLTLFLLKEDKSYTLRFVDALKAMKEGIVACSQCHNLSDAHLCRICTDERRDQGLICVVESIRDLMAIEDTGQFRGLYHVLGGVISPMEGIGPGELHVESLIQRLEKAVPREVIMAISPTIEGETTIFYLARRIEPLSINVSTIARGVSFGGDLEYADELTLGRSISARVPYRRE
jgi:recombination protein RecR